MTVPVIEAWGTLQSTAGTNLSIPPPAGYQENELLICFVGNDDAGFGKDECPLPSGWTDITDEFYHDYAHARAFGKLAAASESNLSYTFGSSDDCFGIMCRISGIDTSAWLDGVAAVTKSTSSVTSHNINGLTTAVDDCLVFYFLCFDGGDGSPFGVSSGWSEDQDWEDGIGGAGVSFTIAHKTQATAGATGAATVTSTVSDQAVQIQFAIAPAAAAGGTINNVTLTDNIIITDPADVILRLRDRQGFSAAAVNDIKVALRFRERLGLSSVNVFDFVKAFRECTRIAADDIAVSDFTAMLRKRLRKHVSIVDVTDYAEKMRMKMRQETSSIDVTDNAEMLRQRFRVLADAIDVVDNVLAMYVKGANFVTLTDVISIVDFNSMLRHRFREQLSGVDVSDFTAEERQRYRKQSSEIGVADFVNQFSARGRMISDTVDINDSSIILRERIRTALSVIDITDNSETRRLRYRIIADAIALVDSIIVTTGGVTIINVTKTDMIILNDFSVELRDRARLLSDTLEMMDSVNLQRHRDRVAVDLIADIVDSFVAYRARLKIQASTVTITDGSQLYTAKSVALTDAIAIADNLLVLRNRYRLLSDDVSVIDAIIAMYLTEILNPIIAAGLSIEPIEIDIAKQHIVAGIEQDDIAINLKDESG